MLLCGAFAAAAFGKTIYVSPDGAGNKDGTSPENAYAGLFCVIGKNQACKASAGDVIKLLPGTYTEAPVSSELYALKELKDIVVEGDTENPANVVFDGQGASVRFFGLGSKAGLTVRGATFKNTNSGNYYEAFYVSDSTLYLEDCVFSAITNTAANGAALYLADHDSIAEIRRCSFTDCASTTGSGGVIARKDAASNVYRVYDCGFTNCCAVNAGALQGPGVVVGCSFSNCQKTGTSSNGGGAIWSNRTDYEIEIRDSEFVDCLSNGKPGGALLLPNVASVTGCTFENCVSTGESGGAASGGSAYTNCVFRNCTSGEAKPGGALYLTASGAEVIDCTFENCMTSGSNPKGGAIYANSSLKMKGGVVDNCGVNKPSGTPYGSAIYVSGSSTFENVEFKNCRAVGGALCVYSATISGCRFHDCSVADSSSGCAIRTRGTGSLVAVENCSFVSMTALRGAAINTNDKLTSLAVRNCLFAGCVSTTGNGGAAIEASATTFSVDNCTFANCRITGSSNDYADPLEIGDGGGSLTANNCIFWDNLKTVGTVQLRSVFVRSGSGTLSNSVYDGMRSSNAPKTSDCQVITACPFVQDGSWNGATFTPGDYTLAKKVAGEENPCLGAGAKLDWMTAESKDLAGNPRLRENDIVDLGCYEYFSKSLGFSIFLR